MTRKKLPLLVYVLISVFISIKAQNNLDRSSALSQVSISRARFDILDVFREPERFERGAKVWSSGIALRTDVNRNGMAHKMKVPPLTLSYEKAIGYNFGLGSRIGYNLWQSTGESKCSVHYYALSVRGAYHLNIHEYWDTYFGFAGTLRGATMLEGKENQTNLRFGASSFIGARYYLLENFAVFGEVGADMMGWFHLGINFKINR